MKVGKIYLEVARRALDAWYGDMPEAEKTALLSKGDFDELELLIGARASIETGCFAIREELEKSEVGLPADFADTVLWSETPKGDLGEKIADIAAKGFFESSKANIAYAAIDMIHQMWVVDQTNASKFFDERRKDKRFMFLRTELIGWDEAEKDLIFVEDALRLLGLMPRTLLIRRAHREKVMDLFQLYGWKDLRNDKAPLVAYIRRADFPHLPARVALAMDDEETASAIADQVLARL